jgi:hypothetical protein
MKTLPLDIPVNSWRKENTLYSHQHIVVIYKHIGNFHPIAQNEFSSIDVLFR